MPPNPLPTHPKDSIPGILPATWWEHDTSKTLKRGRLLHAFVPITSLVPMTLQAQGRATPTAHENALFKLVPMRASQPPPAPRLPVAALPQIPGEVKAVYRAKRRPMLLMSTGGHDLPQEVTRNLGWQASAALLAAPYFGADPDGTRAGWPAEFVQRIGRGEYPQYAYDRLPIGGPKESILRLDQLQPIGRHHDSYELTEYCLSADAMEVIDSWLVWLFTGTLDAKSLLAIMRTELQHLESAENP